MMAMVAKETQFIEGWAKKVKAMGLSTPVILLLETHKPLSFSLSQLVLLGQPVLNLFVSPRLTGNAITLLSQPDYLNAFIDELEKGTV